MEQETDSRSATAPKISTVSVLGCGWLGAPLARNLLAEGFKVKGSTTHPEKKSVMKDVGIRPYLLRLDPHIRQLNPDGFFQTDLLIINIPPQTRNKGQEFHPRQVQAIAEEINKQQIPYCIYISSTSVYPRQKKEITEEDAPEAEKSPQPAVRAAESLLQSIPELNLTILRCGGLMGYNRIPGRYFSGKKDLEEGKRAVNYVHRDDVIGVILEVIGQNYWNQTLNIVAPEHPARKEVFEKNAHDFEFESPSFAQDNNPNGSIISAAKLQHELGYTFRFPDPLHFLYRP